MYWCRKLMLYSIISRKNPPLPPPSHIYNIIAVVINYIIIINTLSNWVSCNTIPFWTNERPFHLFSSHSPRRRRRRSDGVSGLIDKPAMCSSLRVYNIYRYVCVKRGCGDDEGINGRVIGWPLKKKDTLARRVLNK